MAVLEIREFGDPVLRKKAKKVLRVNDSVRQALDALLSAMRAACGAGLAAPQLGLSRRLAVVEGEEGPIFLVNPVIVNRSEETETGWEGCLSWPGYVGEVERALRVTVKALSRDGQEIWVEGEGHLARALQHEIDHLDGILYIDRARIIEEVPKKADLAGTSVVFMGSPHFAVPSLGELTACGASVKLVVTQPDRPAGRKQVLRPTPVKQASQGLDLPVMSCSSLKDPRVAEAIGEASPDFIVVAAFGQKVPPTILDVPRHACLNVHPSLLPKYRGGNPVQRAVMAGDRVTGVSIIHMSDKMDAGDIVLQWAVEIGPDETYGELETRLAMAGAEALVVAMSQILSGCAGRVPQDHSQATVASHLKKSETVIDWRDCAPSVHAFVRGLSPRPGAVTLLEGTRIKVWETHLTGLTSSEAPGTILGPEGDSFLVVAGSSIIRVLKVQPEGRKPMSARDFLMGRKEGAGKFETARSAVHKEGE